MCLGAVSWSFLDTANNPVSKAYFLTDTPMPAKEDCPQSHSAVAPDKPESGRSENFQNALLPFNSSAAPEDGVSTLSDLSCLWPDPESYHCRNFLFGGVSVQGTHLFLHTPRKYRYYLGGSIFLDCEHLESWSAFPFIPKHVVMKNWNIRKSWIFYNEYLHTLMWFYFWGFIALTLSHIYASIHLSPHPSIHLVVFMHFKVSSWSINFTLYNSLYN